MLKFRHLSRSVFVRVTCGMLLLGLAVFLASKASARLETNHSAVSDKYMRSDGQGSPCSTPGDLDHTFNNDGKLTTRLGDQNSSNDIAIQSDGKIISVGSITNGAVTEFLVLRYNTDGSLDHSFGFGGVVTTTFGGNNNTANAVAIQMDGKIVVVGSARVGSTTDFAIARYNTDGSLDPSFDDDGRVTTSFPGPNGDGTDIANAVAIQQDGRIVVTGRVPDGSGTAFVFGTARYFSDGVVDPSFGFRGRTTTSFLGLDIAQSIAIASDGRIVVAGRGSSGSSRLVIARYRTDGSFDNSFDEDGRLLTAFGSATSTFSMALQADDKIVVAGRSNDHLALIRFNLDGSLDTLFGDNGIATTPIHNANYATSLAVQPDGKLAAVGYSVTESTTDFAVVRYNSDGTIDTTFGEYGVVSTPFGNSNSAARSIAIQSDEKIVAAGYAPAGSRSAIAITRYHGAPCGSPTMTATETPTHTPSLTPTESPTETSTPTNTATATPTAIPHQSCSFDNGGTLGGINPQPFTESGVPAPEGSFWSEVQHDQGNFEDGNITAGWSVRQGSFRLADNFSISQPCRINTIDLYGYILEAPDGSSPFTACTLRIWKGRPGNFGSTVVFGDTTTNRLVSSTETSFYRIFNTVVPTGVEPNTMRKLWKNTLAVGTTLPAGAYWIDWAATVIDESNNYSPGKTIAGSRGDAFDNGRQQSGGSPSASWNDVVDPGISVSRNQDFPFTILGDTPSPTPTFTATAMPTTTPTPVVPPAVCAISEGFNEIAALPGAGWFEANRSFPMSASGGWFPGNDGVFQAHNGAANSYIGVNYQSGIETSTLNNWLVSPPLLLQNGGEVSFWTRTVDDPGFPDRLQVRMSTNGGNVNVGTSAVDTGDFATLLLDINPSYTNNGYPTTWTQYVVTISGLASPVEGRIAFRYFVENGGPSGENSDYIGIDTVEYECFPIVPSPSDTPTSTATDTPTDTPTPTNFPSITGAVTYGNSKGLPTERFISDVMLSGTGSAPVTATTNFPSGTYLLSGFGSGAYTIVPSKFGGVSDSITSFDAAMIVQYVTGIVPFDAPQQAVADVSGNGTITSFDASYVARYSVGLNDVGRSGNWAFAPTNRTYPFVTSQIVEEDYSALLMGEVSGNWMNTGARPIGRRQETGDGRLETEAANQGGELFVELPLVVDSSGKEIVVPVNVQGVADKNVISYEFDLRYDPKVIQPIGDAVDIAGTASRGLSVVTNATEPGILRVAVYGALPIDQDGVLLNLRFTAVGNSGWVSPMIFERIMFNEGESKIVTTDGRIELF